MCVGWRARRANHRDAAVTSLIPALSCRLCRPNAPFAELVRLSRTSIAYEMREEHRLRVLGERPRGQGFRRLCCWNPYSDSISVMPNTCSAVTARRHNLHSNVCISGRSPTFGTVRAKRIVLPQHGHVRSRSVLIVSMFMTGPLRREASGLCG
jgi:hypothetical protein